MEGLFPHLDFTPAEWGTFAALLLLGALALRFLLRPKVTVNNVTSSMADRVSAELLEKLPSFVDEKLKRDLESARSEIARLQQEREWVTIGVRIFGFKRAGKPIEAWAPIQLNVKTGEVRAAPKPLRFFTPSVEWFALNCKNAGSPPIPRTELAAPRWKAVRGELSQILVLGELYKLE